MHRLSLLPLALLAACRPAPGPGAPEAPSAPVPAASASADSEASAEARTPPTEFFTLTKDDPADHGTAPASSAHASPTGGSVSPGGRLPIAAIQKVVRLNFSTFRTCYEKGLGRDARLKGRIAVRFVIARNGTVTESADGGSTLPDPEVVRCVVEGFRVLGFPPPDGGPVTVVYPINFSPGG